MTKTTNTTTQAPAATHVQCDSESIARLQILDMIAEALIVSSEGLTPDPNEEAMRVLEELERRVATVAPEGHLIFQIIDDVKAEFLEDGATPNDDEPDFIEMTPADEADIRGEAA